MCISLVPIFNHLEQHEMIEIVKTARMVTFPRGSIIYRAGEKSDSLYIVHEGKVKIYRLSESGKEQIIRFLQPGDFTGEHALFSQSVHDEYAEATADSNLCVVNQSDLHEFLLTYPSISLKVLAEFSKRIRHIEEQATRFATEAVETRIAHYLASLSKQTNSQSIALPMTRKELASYLGTSPETISRKLAEFEDSGWIRQSGPRNMKIIDLDALLRIR